MTPEPNIAEIDAPPAERRAMKTLDGRWYYCAFSDVAGWYPVGWCAYRCRGHENAGDAEIHYAEWRAANP